MAKLITMPKYGLTMTEGNVNNWVKSVGDQVMKGDFLFEVETDKITNEFEAPIDGTILHIFITEGYEIPCGEPIAVIGEEGEDISSFLKGVPEEVSVEDTEEAIRQPEANVSKDAETNNALSQGEVLATPRAKKLALDEDIPLEKLNGTGPNGIVVGKDVQQPKGPAVSPMAKKWADENGVDLTTIKTDKRIMLPDAIAVSLGEQSVCAQQDDSIPEPQPLTGIRKIISSRMSKSWNEVPHVTLNREIDVTETLVTLQTLKEIAQEKKLKVTFTHLLIKIVAEILSKHPYLNAWFDEKGIILHKNVHIGIATALPNGLVVPVLKHAQAKNLEEITGNLATLVKAARENQLDSEALKGGTFTITNLGMLGIDSFTPIINQPETGILGVGRVIERPILVDGELQNRSYVPFSLSFDHRALDGAEAAQFLQDLDRFLQEPIHMLWEGK